jgi:hypothetical protein
VLESRLLVRVADLLLRSFGVDFKHFVVVCAG